MKECLQNMTQEEIKNAINNRFNSIKKRWLLYLLY